MLPRTLEITTKIGCDNNCGYCPQDKLLSAYRGERILTVFNFMQILDNTPEDIQIDFTGFCEPFLNPNASKMIRFVFNQGYKIALATTLTGFTAYDARVISGVRFEKLLIHEFEGCDIKEINRKVKLLKNPFERMKLPEEFRWSRAGNLWDMPVKKGTFECGWTGREYYRNVVLPNGDVYLCCMDYSLKHKLGNIFEVNYNDLNREQIIELSNQDDSDCICRKCEIVKYGKQM